MNNKEKKMEGIFTPTKVQQIKKHIDKFLDNELLNTGISRLEAVYLGCLKDNNGISLIELTNLVHFDKANTTRVISELELKGLVTRKVDEKDTRKYKIYLTEKAKELDQEIAIKTKELEDLKKQFDVYKAKMESLLISQLELIKEVNKD